MQAEMMPMRADPRRNILIVMMSCDSAQSSSVQHQINENSLSQLNAM